RALDLANDLPDGIRRADGFMDPPHGLLRKIHNRGHDIMRIKIHTDEPATLGVKREQWGWTPKVAIQLLPFGKKTFQDQAIHVYADGRRRQAELTGQIDAGETFLCPHPAQQFGFEIRYGLPLDLQPGDWAEFPAS